MRGSEKNTEGETRLYPQLAKRQRNQNGGYAGLNVGK